MTEIIAAIAIIISMTLVIIRAGIGPTTYDRILAANTFGTKTVALIIIISYWSGNHVLIDIALVYGLINFVATIGFLKYFKYGNFGK